MMLPVDIENDLTVTVLSTHDVTPPVGAPVKGAPCVEAPVEQGNLPGIVGHKMTRMVRHRHKRIVQKGHNVGGFILHVSVPPLNVMTRASDRLGTQGDVHLAHDQDGRSRVRDRLRDEQLRGPV